MREERSTALVRCTRVADKLDEEAAYHLIVVTTPGHQVHALLPALQRCKAQWVQFVFVTFEPERLMDAIVSHRCSFGMLSMMAKMDSEGRIKPTIINSLKTLHGDKRLSDDEVCIGDRYRIGSALFEVTQPRVTCYRVGIRTNEPRMPALLDCEVLAELSKHKVLSP